MGVVESKEYSEKEICAMSRAGDVNGDGVISFEEFKGIFAALCTGMNTTKSSKRFKRRLKNAKKFSADMVQKMKRGLNAAALHGIRRVKKAFDRNRQIGGIALRVRQPDNGPGVSGSTATQDPKRSKWRIKNSSENTKKLQGCEKKSCVDEGVLNDASELFDCHGNGFDSQEEKGNSHGVSGLTTVQEIKTSECTINGLLNTKEFKGGRMTFCLDEAPLYDSLDLINMDYSGFSIRGDSCMEWMSLSHWCIGRKRYKPCVSSMLS
mmetsp:Transcript_7752/g.11450  ORF Transcript_7752/g.11450 Transcript_7752/m.11450 type:complete len:265 (-) Transcript_7752:186-980(-)